MAETPSISPKKELTVFIKQVCGRSIVLSIDANAPIDELLKQAHEKRNEAQAPATFENYTRCIQFMFDGKKLHKGLAEHGIQQHSTIMEVARSYSMSPGFSWSTLSFDSVICDDSAQPYILNPGCCHSVDINILRKWVRTSPPTCPICRADILQCHIDTL